MIWKEWIKHRKLTEQTSLRDPPQRATLGTPRKGGEESPTTLSTKDMFLTSQMPCHLGKGCRVKDFYNLTERKCRERKKNLPLRDCLNTPLHAADVSSQHRKPKAKLPGFLSHTVPAI